MRHALPHKLLSTTSGVGSEPLFGQIQLPFTFVHSWPDEHCELHAFFEPLGATLDVAKAMVANSVMIDVFMIVVCIRQTWPNIYTHTPVLSMDFTCSHWDPSEFNHLKSKRHVF